ncbi:MAG: Bacterial sugar transferase [Candidatus Moranbacteria bacterium GW2011_GWF1_34_10]|nr:MAG: Bacterial sugar transferase [Candidatus Moranbacteria bacterium GW2011_GWF1_34_10]
MAKRFLDICISVLALIFLFPVLILIGCAIKVTSEGPVIFKQKRMGYLGMDFTIFKFRTMIDGSGKKIDMVLKNDPRVTELGRFLRSTHLDELPQLWNVLRGEMSLVGPRPRPFEEMVNYINKNPSYKKLLRVRPGITGPTQVYGRIWIIKNKEMAVEENLKYIECKSLLGDLKILLETISVVFRRQGI